MADGDRPEALALRDGRIAHVGTLADCRAAAGPGAEELDLRGRTVLPGFVDAHCHPVMLGETWSWVDVSEAAAPSIADLQARLRERLADLPAGAPLFAYGYNHRRLAERRHPTTADLDAVASDREIYVMNASGHGGILNTHGLKVHGIHAGTRDVPGGEIGRDAAGHPDGLVMDAACDLLTGETGVKIGRHGPNLHLPTPPPKLDDHFASAQRAMLRHGVTTAVDAQVTRRELETYRRALDAGRSSCASACGSSRRSSTTCCASASPARSGASSSTSWASSSTPTARSVAAPPGSPAAITATPPSTGCSTTRPRRSTSSCCAATRPGCTRAPTRSRPRRSPWSWTRSRPPSRPPPGGARCRTRSSTAGSSRTPTSRAWSRWASGPTCSRPITTSTATPPSRRWGKETGERYNPAGLFARAGMLPVLSSDAPVSEPNPLEAVRTAVDRTTVAGHRLGGDELALDVHTALLAHTAGAARAAGRGHEVGTLEVGKRADLVVLTGDPTAATADGLREIAVAETWIGGDVSITSDRGLRERRRAGRIGVEVRRRGTGIA